MGADIVVGEGQSIGVGLNFGGPYVGLFACQREVRPADAGPAGRRDGRCRGQARLRADPVDPRAAYPPREGDLEHLHQLGLCALAFTIHMTLLGEKGLRAARRRSTTPRRSRPPSGWRRCRASSWSTTPSSTNSRCGCRRRRGRWCGRMAEQRRARRRLARAGSIPATTALAERPGRRGHRDRHRRGCRGACARRSRRRWHEHEPERLAPDARPRPATARRRPTPATAR